MMRNYNGIQTILKTVGDYGCYLLSIANHFKYQGDIVELYGVCLKNEWIKNDCTVLQPAKIANYLGGGQWDVTVATTVDIVKMGYADFYVECWHNDRTNYTHFRLHESDTLKNSVTVREGKIISYRLFKLKGNK